MASKEKTSLDHMEFADIEEFEGLRLDPFDVRYIMNYLSSSCGLDANKAYRMTLGEEEFKAMSKGKFYGRVRALKNKSDVITAVSRLLTKEVGELRQEIIPNLLNDLTVAASYDPMLIIDDDGDLRGGSMSDVPQKYRRAVIEGIGVRYWGKECQVRTREVKLTSKSKARQQLIELSKLLNGLQEVDTGTNFTVNLSTHNIDGMSTASELLKQSVMASAKTAEDVAYEKVKEDK